MSVSRIRTKLLGILTLYIAITIFAAISCHDYPTRILGPTALEGYEVAGDVVANVHDSFPAPGGARWTVSAKNENTTGTQISLNTFAIVRSPALGLRAVKIA